MKEEAYGHTSITRDGRLVEGKDKPKGWAVHYYEVCDDRQWADMTYRFEAQINPDVSFKDTVKALARLRASSQKFDKEIVSYLERMAMQERSSSVDSLFLVRS